MQAIKIVGPKKARLTGKARRPDLPDDCVLVKTKAVALNPTDWKHVDFIPTKGATVGCDYSGVLEEVGPSVQGFRIGDRVAGFTHGCNGENLSDGSFAEYIAVKAHIQIKLPASMKFEDGCTLAVGLTTVAQGLYQFMKLPLPMFSGTPSQSSSPQESILIYGGSTATGTLAIQFAKLSGYRVLTTCSPHNFPLVLERGADHVFDYRQPDLAAHMRNFTSDSLLLVLDCITTADSISICCGALSSSPNRRGKYCGLFTVGTLPRDDIDSGFTMAYKALGESFQKWDNYYPGNAEDALFAGSFMTLASTLLHQGRIKPHPAEVREGGLKGVLGGLQAMREGKVSGAKLVYVLEK